MNARIASLALLIASSVAGTAYAFKNEPDGFRGIKWGEPFKSYQAELKLTDTVKNLQVYSRANDWSSLGAANLSSVSYVFYKSQFFAALLTTTGITNKSALIEAFNEDFGQGIQRNPYRERYVWSGPQAMILVDCTSVKEECSALLQSTESNRDMEADEAAAAKNGR